MSTTESSIPDDIDYGEPIKPHWFCESCGFESHTKAMPRDREKFYARVHATQTCPTCPKCKSQTFMPVGF